MRLSLALMVVLISIAFTACGGAGSTAPPPTTPVVSVEPYPTGEFANPLRIALPDGSTAESCPDPSIIRGQTTGDDYWYLYCTNERFADYAPVHLLPISRSKDLVSWTYVGDVFTQMPSWVAHDGGLWAPDIQFFNGKYYLYYSASNTPRGGAAIFVATSSSPTGPWSASSVPVVEPGPAPCCAGTLRATIDSNIVSDGDTRFVFYGSFNGGISARLLSPDGMRTDKSTQVQIALADRYEAAYVVNRDGYFYLMVSAGNCCSGPLSGYGVYAARSKNVLGPYLDKDGNSLLDTRIGGTPVLEMNGNRWIGPGHNAVATDAAGQDWMIYHAIDADKPYFAGSWTRRPVMADAIDWIGGWPRVRGGAGASDTLQSAPVMQAGAANTHTVTLASEESVGNLLAALSDDFSGSSLSPQWTWIRKPAASDYVVANGSLEFHTQPTQLYIGRNDGAVLTESAPAGDYLVEVKLSTNVPLQGTHNFVQAGLVIFRDDGNYIKLVNAAINSTRQIEFAKQVGASNASSGQYGSTLLSSPADDTYLRIVKHSTPNGGEAYTAYSSHDGATWERGGTWTHRLGATARIGLVSQSGAGFSTYFDYVRVYGINSL